MLQPGHRFGDGFSLRHAHKPDAGDIERMLHRIEILLWNDRDVDFACNQCVDRLCVVGIQ